ncbi:hypothetical protein H4219_001494 [Mycoemilia scoparia]|uniref:ATP-dependent RNA helicase n=1 Tax=Mycoemilia scoparia TaxID=417184 RepID=A0A9W8A9A4_9FUNG|nr:hypothetical protein H4219_001494 [Mycoemilia scoparia]
MLRSFIAANLRTRLITSLPRSGVKGPAFQTFYTKNTSTSLLINKLEPFKVTVSQYSSLAALASEGRQFDLSEQDQQNNENEEQQLPAKFQDCNFLSKDTLHALKTVMKIDTPSKVQQRVLSILPTNADMMIKAKTGTGKTLGFLIPAIETLLAEYSNNEDRKLKGREIGILVVSPTRELANQIAQEAAKISTQHKFGVRTIVGGERPAAQITGLKKYRSDIVVGTPGRLVDFLTNQRIFIEKAQGTKVLIFDEADELLQMGFKDEIDQIINAMPKDRQTIMVSATFNDDIKRTARNALKSEFKFLDCVSKDEANTNVLTKQEYARVDYDQHFKAIYKILKDAMTKSVNQTGDGTKIIVFCPTTKTTEIYYKAIRSMFHSIHDIRDFAKYKRRAERNDQDFVPAQVLRIHGRMSQDKRTRTSRDFRHNKTNRGMTSILVTSDVSARGVDYPDVSTVVQVGIPSDPAHYIHRVGRTGRAGKEGYGIILLSDAEHTFLKQLPKLPITENPNFTSEHLEEIGQSNEFAEKWKAIKSTADEDELKDAHDSLLGFYAGKDQYIKATGEQLIKMVGGLTEAFDIPPPLVTDAAKFRLGLHNRDRRNRPMPNRSRGGGNKAPWMGRGSFARGNTKRNNTRDSNSGYRRNEFKQDFGNENRRPRQFQRNDNYGSRENSGYQRNRNDRY